MTAEAGTRGLLDTSTVILLPQLDDASVLPSQPFISTITLAELSVGPLVAAVDDERAARQAHVQQAEADFDAIPFDTRLRGRSAGSRRHSAAPGARQAREP